MGHCGGGTATLDRFDMLTAILTGLKGVAGSAIAPALLPAAAGRSAHTRSMRTKGSGDGKAESFECGTTFKEEP
jgi:hypothetical protein